MKKIYNYVLVFILPIALFSLTGCDENGDTDCALFGDCGGGGGGGNICSNSCTYAYDGVCDDGGPGSSYNVCACGTDCGDCGARTSSECGGGGGGTSIMVWTQQDWGCGSISVYIDGSYAGAISSYYSGGAPSCGASGCVTASVSAGYHTVSGSCSSYTWNPIGYNVTSGDCLKIQFN